MLEMAFIYVITNNINNKQYIGKTNTSIEKRWNYHKKDAHSKWHTNAPLYRAFNKYGIENFSIKQLEECSADDVSNKEIYWIDKLNTYHNGYNATLGGDSKHYYNYQEIASKYQELQSQKETAEYFNCDLHTVRTACKECGIEITSATEVNRRLYGKSVLMIDINTDKVLQKFDFIKEAYDYIDKPESSHIQEVCNGKRKTAYGYKWQWSDKTV